MMEMEEIQEEKNLAVGMTASMKRAACEQIIDEIQTCVTQMLGEYLKK